MNLLNDEQLEKYWIELGDIPFDEDVKGELILAEKYLHFVQGTEREFIWHWFDENHSKGVYFLLMNKLEQEVV